MCTFIGITPQLSGRRTPCVWGEVCIFHHPRSHIIWIFMAGWRGDVGWARGILCLVLITPSSHPIIHHTPPHVSPPRLNSVSKYKMHREKEDADMIRARVTVSTWQHASILKSVQTWNDRRIWQQPEPGPEIWGQYQWRLGPNDHVTSVSYHGLVTSPGWWWPRQFLQTWAVICSLSRIIGYPLPAIS